LKWFCKCPFCKNFEKKYPFEYTDGWKWFFEKKAKSVETHDLKVGGNLFSAYPLLSEPKGGGVLRKAINFTRMSHNHWVLGQVIADIRKNSRTRKQLTAFVERFGQSYIANTNKSVAARAIAASIKIATSGPLL
jgi:hypothetical protein